MDCCICAKNKEAKGGFYSQRPCVVMRSHPETGEIYGFEFDIGFHSVCTDHMITMYPPFIIYGLPN